MIKCDICGDEATLIEEINGNVYGAICDRCISDNLEDADEYNGNWAKAGDMNMAYVIFPKSDNDDIRKMDVDMASPLTRTSVKSRNPDAVIVSKNNVFDEVQAIAWIKIKDGW